MIINDLCLSFKNKELYKNFSLTIDNDKVTCILGPSGIGKTTLLNVICNNVKYKGYIGQVSKVAYVFQNSRLINSISVEKNLELVMDKKNNQKLDGVLSDLKILDCKTKYPNQLSGGQASRVSIARALLYNAQFILLDEPFKDLDIVLKHEIISLFEQIIEKDNIGAVYVTHDVDEALSIADRIIVLDGEPVNVVADIDIKTKRKDRDLSCVELNNARQQIYKALIK